MENLKSQKSLKLGPLRKVEDQKVGKEKYIESERSAIAD